MLEDLMDDPVALAVGLAVLLALLMLGGWWWWRTRRRSSSTAAAAAALVRESAAPQGHRPAPAALPALSLDSFAPLHPAEAPRPSKPAPPLAPEGGLPPVLVVDDSAVARTLLRRLLQGAGYRVDLASDGAEALVLLGSQRYAVLITDLEMPRMDGLMLIAALQTRPDSRDLPIIAITAHEELSARVHDMKGLFGIFHKPWNDADLLARVASLARLRGAAPAG